MPAFGYRREPPDLDSPESVARAFDAQGMAIAAACARRQIELSAMYSERAYSPPPGAPRESGRSRSRPQWLALIHDAADLVAGGTPTTLVLPTLRVLGDRARERVIGALQAAATGATVLLASDEPLADAMRTTWEERDEGDRHAERVREGMQRRALRGYALGRPPYGYRVIEHRLQVEPDEARVVREIVRLYLGENLGVRRIAATLNDRGLTTRQGRPWSATAVRDILRNTTYLGTARRLGVIVSAAHPAILSRAEFDAIQGRMSDRRTAPSEQLRREYLLSGLARCGYCGNRLIGVRRPGAERELLYYQCESATNQGRCAYHSRRAEDLESEVRALLANIVGELELPPLDPAADVERVEVRRRGVQRELDRTIAAWTAGELSTARLIAEAGPSALDDLELEAQLDALAEAGPAPRADPDAEHQLLEGWDALPFEERRDLMRRILGEVVVTDTDVRLVLGTNVRRRSAPPGVAPRAS
ncbi:MAG: recombinase family protein [Dehalococcoidia bacterium]